MYALRYFFDPGSGTCLWAANDDTRDAFGYAVDHDALPLTDDTRVWLEGLIEWFDESINWDDPGGPSPWNAVERANFAQAAAEGLARLRRDLPEADYALHEGTLPAS